MHYVQSLTYAEGYRRHVGPALERQKNPPEAVGAPDFGTQQAFVDQWCGGRMYEGEKWWLPFVNGDGT